MRDVITVVRAFRPHVIVSVFSGTPADGHGHHQVAGLLAREAYDVSGDTLRFPRRMTGGNGGWTVQKFYRGALFRNQAQATLRINVGEFDAVSGRSYSEVASDSRSQHKSQAMGALQVKGARFDQLLREAARSGPADARSERGLLDGVDTTWARFRPAMRTTDRRVALDSLPGALLAARRQLDLRRPGDLVPALGAVQRLLARICGAAGPDNPCASLAADGRSLVVHDGDLFRSVEVASARVEAALALATGVAVEATAAREVLATGEVVRIGVATYNRGAAPVRLTRRLVVGPATSAASLASVTTVLPDSVQRDSIEITPLANGGPWWLATRRQGAMFGVPGADVDEAQQRNTPTVLSIFGVGETTFGVFTPVTLRFADAVKGEINRPVAGAPAIDLTLDRDVEYAQANVPLQRTIRVHVRSHAREARTVDVRLALPAGLVADSSTRRVVLLGLAGTARENAQGPVAALLGLTGGPDTEAVTTVTFNVRGRLAPGRHQISATATSGGEVYATGYQTVAYDHIRTQRLYRAASLAIEAVDVRLPRGTQVAYINGVGDNVAPLLQQLGVSITVLDPSELGRADLSRYTAVVVGTRAYEASPILVANNARLLEYARNGGTVVTQYGQYEMLAPGMLPYPITLGRPADRVTVEGAPVRVLDPSASLLNAPNAISATDFEGWVQDRALYMPRTFDPAWRPLLEMNDPGEPANRGALLVSSYGKGTWVYTSLAFFRQLPNGVPGAARLLVNLLAARPDRVAQ